jgi:hypothetical protein
VSGSRSTSSTRSRAKPSRSGAGCDPRLLRALERIAEALEQNTQAQLMLLDELTSEPEPEQKDEGETFLDGSPRH